MNYIARALQTFPPVAKAPGRAKMGLLHSDVPRLGRVRITAKRFKHKRGRSMHYF